MWNCFSEKFFCAVIFYLKFCEKGETFVHVFCIFFFSFVRTRLQNITFSTLLSSCMIPDQESTKRQSLPPRSVQSGKKTDFAPPSSILRYQQPHKHQSYVFSTSEKNILHVPRWLAAGGALLRSPSSFHGIITTMAASAATVAAAAAAGAASVALHLCFQSRRRS